MGGRLILSLQQPDLGGRRALLTVLVWKRVVLGMERAAITIGHTTQYRISVCVTGSATFE